MYNPFKLTFCSTPMVSKKNKKTLKEEKKEGRAIFNIFQNEKKKERVNHYGSNSLICLKLYTIHFNVLLFWALSVGAYTNDDMNDIHHL